MPDRVCGPVRPPVAGGRSLRNAVRDGRDCEGCHGKKWTHGLFCIKCEAKLTEEEIASVGPMVEEAEFGVNYVAVIRRLRGGAARPACAHERLNEEGQCRACGADKRGIGE